MQAKTDAIGDALPSQAKKFDFGNAQQTSSLASALPSLRQMAYPTYNQSSGYVAKPVNDKYNF